MASLATLLRPKALHEALAELSAATVNHSAHLQHEVEHAERLRKEREAERELKAKVAAATGSPAG
jgi:hypothetical protein